LLHLRHQSPDGRSIMILRTRQCQKSVYVRCSRSAEFNDLGKIARSKIEKRSRTARIFANRITRQGRGFPGVDRPKSGIDRSREFTESSEISLSLSLGHLSAVPHSCAETSSYPNDVTTIRAPCNQHVTTVIIYDARRCTNVGERLSRASSSSIRAKLKNVGAEEARFPSQNRLDRRRIGRSTD